MKTNKISFIAALLVGTFSLQSCEKFLDKNPDNRTEINSVDKVAQLVATAYPSSDYLYFTESASDNAEDKGNGVGSLTDVMTRPYFWEDFIGSGTGSTTSYWNGCYQAIAAANQALESIEKNNIGAGALPYKGEALVARAYAHFMLVTFFSKAYVIGGANDSPGIPYVTEPETEVIKQYTRGTVASTYQKIEADLVEGMKLLSPSAHSVPKYHFTPAAAHAFASRFYLFKGEWQKVVDHATAAVPAGDFASNLRPNNTTYRSIGFPEYNVSFSRSDQKSVLLLANQYSGYQRETSPRYGYGQKLVTMFDNRYNFTGKTYANWVVSYGVPNYTTYKWREYFHRVSPNANTGFPYIMSVLLTVDETLANRAEAYAQLGQFDRSLADINTWYSTLITNYSSTADVATADRLKTFYGLADTKEALIKAILDTKKAQFLQEGLRWLDILRHRITVTHNVFAANGQETFITLGPDDNRRVFQIPEEAKLSGIELNPR